MPSIAAESGCSLSVVGIPTRGDVESTLRALRSYLANAQRFDRRLRFIVASDEPEPTVRASFAAALASLSSEMGQKVRYAGMAERHRWCVAMAKSTGIHVDLLCFAVAADADGLGSTSGANANVLLLDTLGGAFLKVDDDTACEIRTLRATRPGEVELSSRAPPIDIVPFARREDFGELLAPQDLDFIGAHEEYLGRGGDTGLALPDGLRSADASLALADAVLRRKAHVACSWSGIYGDSGSSSPAYLLRLGGWQLRRWTRDEAHYRHCRESRLVWKGVANTTIANSSFFQGTAVGFDNRALLPPFFPRFRATDSGFGQTLRRVDPDALFAYLPASIAHQPASRRRDPAEALWRSGTVSSVAGLYSLCLATFDPRDDCVPPRARLASLGKHLRNLASLATADFQAALRPAAEARASTVIATYRSQIGSFGAEFPYLRQDLERGIEALERAVRNDDLLVPLDAHGALASHNADTSRGDVSAAIRHTRDLIGQFGRLLEVWPHLVAVVAADGTAFSRISRPIGPD